MPFRRTLTTTSAVALATGLALTAAPTSSAHAARATHSVESVDFTIAGHPPTSAACGFPVTLHVWGTWNVVSFADGDGNLTKEIRNFRFRGELSANGVTIQGISRGPEITTFHDADTFTVAVHGIVNRRTPGMGTVTLASGLTVTLVDGDVETVLAQSGPDDEHISEVCAAFTA